MKHLMLYENFINESIKVIGKENENIKIIFKEVAKFYTNKLMGEEKINITIILKKLPKNEIGNLKLKNMMDKKNFKIEINKDSGMVYNFGTIAHELTHIKQVYFNELKLSDDKIIWKGENCMTIEELNTIVNKYDIKSYKNLPWEKEAYENQKEFPKLVKDSKEIQKLRDVNATLSFLIDSIY